MKKYFDRLNNDIRFQEGMKACFNCGTCTAVCPAAAVSEYDPRMIVDTVQQQEEESLIGLLKSNEIWMCGECLSCKTRCPRGNTPGYIIQSLRALSLETGFFIESSQGRKQLALKRTIGEHILKYGYCVHIDEVDNEMFPEQGPIWEWFRKNRSSVLERLGASYGQEQAGTLRTISTDDLEDLKNIFEETGAWDRFQKLESDSESYAEKHHISFSAGKDNYFKKLYNEP